MTIEIITKHVDMPDLQKRKFQKEFIKNKWFVIDSETNAQVFKGKFEDAALACHNLNKKHYLNIANQKNNTKL